MTNTNHKETVVTAATPRRQCTAKAKSTGERCGRRPVPGADVCKVHGGAARQVKAAAERRLAEARAERELSALASLGLPIRKIDFDDPQWVAREMANLVGEVLGWKDLAARKVAELDAWTVGENSMPRGELMLLIKFIDQCERVLSSISRLKLADRWVEAEERKAVVEQRRQELNSAFLGEVLVELGLSPDEPGMRDRVSAAWRTVVARWAGAAERKAIEGEVVT